MLTSISFPLLEVIGKIATFETRNYFVSPAVLKYLGKINTMSTVVR